MINAYLTYNVYDPNVIRVGTGSGDLTISQASTGAVSGQTILIKAGTYGTITIEDFDLLTGQRVFVKNEGQVIINTLMRQDNLRNVTISGDYVVGMMQGFKFMDVSFRAIRMSGVFSGVVNKAMLFKDVGDYCIAPDSDITGLAYDGTSLTCSQDIKFIDLEFDNANGIHWNGDFNYDTLTDTGFVQRLEVSGCYFHDYAGNGQAYGDFHNVEGYDVHHNKLERLNASNDEHNGLFIMRGQGDFHHNYCNDFQGNSIRAFTFSRGDVPRYCKIYDNIVANTRKYSAFEFQTFSYYGWPGKATSSIGECFQNTVYNMNYAPVGEAFHGVILDIFNMSGSIVSAWNNVGIHFDYPDGSNYIFGSGIPTNAYVGTNRYYATLAEAGLTEDGEYRVLGGSPLLSGTYRVNPYDIDDFYGNPRVGVPTIGAVQ